MFADNLIDAIRLPFRKEKELYRSLYSMMGFYPRKIELYKEALMHKSALARSKGGRPLNNERLEYLGDAILGAAVGEILFRHFQGKREGFLTNARSRIVGRETLGKVAVSIGLDKLIVSNNHSVMHNSYMEGNAFEALIGAIYMDRGYKRCLHFLNNKILSGPIDLDKMAYKDVNFKSRLLEWSQKHKLKMELVSQETGKSPNGSPMFSSQVLVAGIECGTGTGYSKKESQQTACKEAWYRIRKDKELHDTLLQHTIKTTTHNEPNGDHSTDI